MCEAMVIGVRFIDEEWHIKQRVPKLMLLAKSMTGEEVARQLRACLSTELGIPSDKLLASTRDRASVNNVAMQNLKIFLQFLILAAFRTLQIMLAKIWKLLYL